MLEITPEDIAALNDEQLRELVGRLCEAELTGRGFSPSHVTYGGNQNAPDGGIDVRVALPPNQIIDGFIPCAATGFQVKRQDMPAGEISAEMRPGGIIRYSIQDLADQSGAYIIVSSQGSTADSVLTSRREAMRLAVAGIRNADALTLDFLDRTRVAQWVRSHKGIIPWVRQLVGRAMPGWQSYGAWAYASAAVKEEYLVDEKLRLYSSRQQTDQGISVVNGINKMRDELRQVRHVVRLVGLSGLGKTRLVQALFDDKIGERSLDRSLAFYTNMSDGPEPQPIALASTLVTAGTPAILVVDNCPPDLHQRLSEVCRDPASKTSVITIEYDIREDESEGTELFELRTSSPELIGRLIRQRFSHVSQTDIHTIAEFSGGNPKIAIALAATLQQNDTLAGLTDGELFQRLFLQRHAHDPSLDLAAQALSLVYSFRGDNVSGDAEAELVHLGRLIGQSAQELYRHTAELLDRDLAQKRGVWRAVLPQAIANRLAVRGLKNIPYDEIEQHLIINSPPRLLKSFSRRLGYLHKCEEAVQIVRKWLGAGGFLGTVTTLDEGERTMFKNVAPAAPAEALTALERAVRGVESEDAVREFQVWRDLVRSLAYDAALFERCVALLIRILAADRIDKDAHGIRQFRSLFQLRWSGTHADVEQRAKVVESLLASVNERERTMGVLALEGMLEARHFMPGGGFEFGARSRDFGYWPRTKDEACHWFAVSLELIERFSFGQTQVLAQTQAALAKQFDGLWMGSGITDEIARVCRTIKATGFWPEGWIAVKQTLRLHGAGLETESIAELSALEADLRPSDLAERVRATVFPDGFQDFETNDFHDNGPEDFEARLNRVNISAQELGRAVAIQETTFAELLPEMVSKGGQLWAFGQGLAQGAIDPRSLWDRLVNALAATEPTYSRPNVLAGFLNQLQIIDEELSGKLLDETVDHQILGRIYPALQVAVKLKERDIERLKYSVVRGISAVQMYEYLSSGGVADPIPPPDLRNLVLSIAALPLGYSVASEILNMRLFSDANNGNTVATDFLEAGCDLLEQFKVTRTSDRDDYRLGEIAKYCLKGDQGYAATKRICVKLKYAVARHETNALYHDDLMMGLFVSQPNAALEALCGGDQVELDAGIRMLHDVHQRKYVMGLIPEEDLLIWCDQEPYDRYPAIAKIVAISETSTNQAAPKWTSAALHLLERAPNPGAVLRQFVLQLVSPGAWTGSSVAVMESKSGLLDQLGAFAGLSDYIRDEKERLATWIAESRQREAIYDQERDERFE